MKKQQIKVKIRILCPTTVYSTTSPVYKLFFSKNHSTLAHMCSMNTKSLKISYHCPFKVSTMYFPVSLFLAVAGRYMGAGGYRKPILPSAAPPPFHHISYARHFLPACHAGKIIYNVRILCSCLFILLFRR